jgi:hypothetical protein
MEFNYIQNGATAVEAVEAAVRVLEENENFNAGRGSLLNSDHEVECDAMIMEGHTLNNGRITLTIYMLLKLELYEQQNCYMLSRNVDTCCLVICNLCVNIFNSHALKSDFVASCSNFVARVTPA